MKIAIPAAILVAPLLFSCASNTDKAAGINSCELRALKETYYWEDRYDPPTFKQGELVALMDRSADSSLDGERSERQASAVAAALATVGDEHFAMTLKSRIPEVQRAVISNIRYMWTHYRLSYPMTQAIDETKKQGEQGGDGDAEEAV
jgi:hypothetical protein